MGPRVDALLADLADELLPYRPVVLRIAIVDDTAVTDVAPQLLNQAPAQVRPWPSATNGPAINRNRGARDSAAEWLVFLDDDVRLSPGWGAGLMNVINDPGAADLIGGRIGSQHPRNWFSQAAEDFVVRHREYPEGWYLAAAHLLVRRTAFERLGGFDARFAYGAEDWDLSQRAHAAGLAVGISDTVAVAHANPRTWGQLRVKATQYGGANAVLDNPGSADSLPSPGASDVTSPTANRSALPSPMRGARWAYAEYRGLRSNGRGRTRALRSLAMYIPWMAVYLRTQATHRPAGT